MVTSPCRHVPGPGQGSNVITTVIIGDLSGLQSFLFALSSGEGGQARCLRARSFFVQVLAECCVMQLLEAAQWSSEKVVFCGAAKFVLSAGGEPDRGNLLAAADGINEWLLTNLGAQLSFALAISSGKKDETIVWSEAAVTLQCEKLHPWARISQKLNRWHSEKLVLSKVHLDSHNRPTVPNASIFDDREIGARLPSAKWLEIGRKLNEPDFRALDYSCKIHESYPAGGPSGIALFALANESVPKGYPPPERRYLARHVPTDRNNYPVTFETIATYSKGDKLLGVLKIDVDSLGLVFEHLQKEHDAVMTVSRLSQELDQFFAVTLDEEKRREKRWQSIYTVFSGGDDLLAVGPWSIMFDYADHVRALFVKEFDKRGLTISAGLAIVKPKFPIQRAAVLASNLLTLSKTLGKNRLAAFGQVWLWADHAAIINAADKLTSWVERKMVHRSWLEEILQFAEAAAATDRFRIDLPGLSEQEIKARKRASLLATARLAYQTGRNYRRDFRDWVRGQICDLENQRLPIVRNLPAILRYAITNTRSGFH